MAWDARKYYLPQYDRDKAYKLVMNYPRNCAIRDTMIYDTPSGDNLGVSGTRYAGKPTESKALRLEEADRQTAIVDRALDCIPWQYREPIIDHIAFNKSYPRKTARSCQRWTDALLWHINRISNRNKKSRG